MRNPKMRFRTLQDEHYSDYESRALTWIFNKAAPLNGGSRFFHT